MMTKLLALAVVLAPAPAATPAQHFDLVCSGSEKVIALGNNHEDAWSTTYHVDLANKKWCQDSCSAIFDFYAIQPASLQFKGSPGHIAGDETTDEDEAEVDRATGDYDAIHAFGRGIDRAMFVIKGTCSKRPSAGFPKVETKF